MKTIHLLQVLPMKILVIEDSNSLRYVVVKILKEYGYKDFNAVESAEEGLMLLERDKYNLILLDWNLPKMSGFDFLKLVRSKSEYNSVSIVMVTTMHERRHIVEALKNGLQGYILKPVDKKILLAKLKEIEDKLDSVPAAT